jgi:glycosyltransferase involved in cell wall biosynthesis
LSHEQLNYHYNAADLLLLTSVSEGSPNVIKEALACNCPIVATDVGDIREVIAGAEQCHVTGFDAGEIAAKMKQVLREGKRSNGREKVLRLDSRIIADQLVRLYERVAEGGS